MNTKDAVKQVMKGSKTTQVQLAKLLGYSGQSSIAERLKSDMQISTLRAMMDATVSYTHLDVYKRQVIVHA